MTDAAAKAMTYSDDAEISPSCATIMVVDMRQQTMTDRQTDRQTDMEDFWTEVQRGAQLAFRPLCFDQ